MQVLLCCIGGILLSCFLIWKTEKYSLETTLTFERIKIPGSSDSNGSRSDTEDRILRLYM